MFKWLLPKLDLSLAEIELSNVVEKLLVVAGPMLDEHDERVRWQETDHYGIPGQVQTVSVSDANAQATAVGDYFRPEDIHKRHRLDIGTSATYIAEGKLKFPNLTPQEYTFTFGFPTHHDREESHWWVLQLRDFQKVYNSRFPKEVVSQMLEELKHNPAQFYRAPRESPKSLNKLVKPIVTNIEHRFLGDGSSESYRSVRQRVQELKTEGSTDAKTRYEAELEAQLREWHLGKQIQPQLYTYSIVDTRLILDL